MVIFYDLACFGITGYNLNATKFEPSTVLKSQNTLKKTNKLQLYCYNSLLLCNTVHLVKADCQNSSIITACHNGELTYIEITA